MLEEKYPYEAWTRVYTYGSASDAVENGGARLIEFTDGGQETFLTPLTYATSTTERRLKQLPQQQMSSRIRSTL